MASGYMRERKYQMIQYSFSFCQGRKKHKSKGKGMTRDIETPVTKHLKLSF